MKYILPCLAATIILSACSKNDMQFTQNDLLQNPLFAETFAEELVGRLANLEIAKDPTFANEATKKYAETTKLEWQKVSAQANKQVSAGKSGTFMPITTTEFTGGDTLLLNNTLYFGPTFVVSPAPSIQIYMSKNVDPREGKFPAPEDAFIAELASPYGAQQVHVTQNTTGMRTIVLYDPELKRILSFAQLN